MKMSSQHQSKVLQEEARYKRKGKDLLLGYKRSTWHHEQNQYIDCVSCIYNDMTRSHCQPTGPRKKKDS